MKIIGVDYEYGKCTSVQITTDGDDRVIFVPVVHCIDCIYYEANKYGCWCGLRGNLGINNCSTTPNDYCSRAKRKE